MKDIRRTRQCKDDRAALDGPHLLAEALAAGIEPEAVFVTPEFADDPANQRLLDRLPGPPTLVDAAVLAAMADADSPRGVLTVVRLPRPDVLPARPAGTWIYLAGVQDPGNLGAIARVAEAAGATALALGSGCAHPSHPRALRASAGSLLRLPVHRGLDFGLAASREGLGTLPWIGLVPRGGEPLWQADIPSSFVLALGAEGPGLPSEVETAVGRRITIPMARTVESLNVAVAAAVVLFEWSRRHGSGGRRDGSTTAAPQTHPGKAQSAASRSASTSSGTSS